MALRTAYRQIAEGIRVPYGAAAGGNHGFVDLRGRPDLARTIAEAAPSRAFRGLLVRLAEPGAAIVSLGCDLGEHVAAAAPANRRRVAGGYLHLIAALCDTHEAQAYHALAKALEAIVAADVGNRSWELAFVLQDVELRLDGVEPQRRPSMTVCFYASAPNEAAAVRSRETLIGALDAALTSPLVLATLRGDASGARND